MQLKDIRKLFLGLNKDLDPSLLQNGEFTDGLNIRVASSDQQQGIGPAETMQSEIELLIDVSAPIYYGGSAIGGDFVYSGYEEVIIGTQTWLKRNWDANYPGSKVYNNNESNRAIYGGLYTYQQILESDFCPPGWHVPTEAEANTLLSYLGGALIAGGKMKEPSTSHWLTPNTGANDISGFKGLPGGKMDAIFSLLGEKGLFWILGEGYPWAPIALPATDITPLTFMAHWEASDGATGYYLDVATDIAFTSFVAGYNNLNVGNVLQYMIGGLNPTNSYYYRLRAYNEIDTSDNSNIITVTTSAVVLPLIDKDSNIYTTVIIGNQEWIIENYKVTKYSDGTAIRNITDAVSTDLIIPPTLWQSHGAAWIAFNHVGSEISSAIADGSVACVANGEQILAPGAVDYMVVKYTLTLNSGGAPRLRIQDDDGLVLYNEILTAGTHSLYLLLAGYNLVDNFDVFLANTDPDLVSNPFATNFALTGVEVTIGGWTGDTEGAYCWRDNDIINKTPYGAIYNWPAVNNARGLAYLERGAVQETGWRVPTEADWIELRNLLGGELVAGGKLKEVGLGHWQAPNTGAVDSYGFKALPTGTRTHDTGVFGWFPGYGFIWASDEFDATQAYFALLNFNNANLGIYNSGMKNTGMAVRLVRDVAGVGGVTWDSTLITFDSTLITFDET